MDVDDKLREQIIRLCEKQYRKGLQHGAHFYKSNFIDLKGARDFRQEGEADGYRQMVNPLTNKKEDAVFRLVTESSMDDMQELQQLLSGATSLDRLAGQYNPLDALSAKKKKYYKALPERFTTADAIVIGELHGISQRSVKYMLKQGSIRGRDHIFNREWHGKYTKLIN